MIRKNLLLWGASALVLGAAGAAAAQEPTVAPLAAAPPAGSTPASSGTVGEVVVTGTRIVGTFTAPTPVTTVTAQQLQTTAVTTLAQGLQQLPSVTPGGGPTAGAGTGNGGQNFLGLRGLGANRTLTLVDGRRFTPSGPAGTVDSNLIPAGLVSRVDVVTGGASAAYGSDAVAGVINFVLDMKMEGVKIDAHYGESEHGDNKDYRLTVDAGHRYADGRGHVLLGLEWYDNKGVDGSRRSFRQTAPNEILLNGGYVGIGDLRTPFPTGGLVVIGAGGTAAANAAFEGIQFSPTGNAVPYSYGSPNNDIGGTAGFQNGGDGFRVSTGQEIIRPLKRQTVFLHNDFQVTPAVNFFTEFNYAATNSTFDSSPTTHTLTIQRDNAFLARSAPELVARMTALGVTRLTLNRLTLERGPTYTVNDNYTIRALAGFKGEVKGWHWDVSIQDGENRNKGPQYNNLDTTKMALAADAVFSPTTGQIVCRSTLTSPGNGCVPFNPFGEGAPSQAALNYVLGYVPTSLTQTYQTAADANLSGELFMLPGGPIGAAVGAEWRQLSARTTADPLSNAGVFRLVNQQDFYGKYNVKEAYAELNLPLLANKRFVERFNVDIAGRHTDYSTSGGVNTWKVGADWQIVSDFRLRGTVSRDIRAPSLQELFATGRQNNIVVNDTLTNKTYAGVPNKTFGNIDLQPEVAKTLVFGFVYQPSWLNGFSFALDKWAIRINGAIGNVGGQNAVDQCNLANQNSPICAFIIRDPSTRAIIGTITAPANLTVTKASGYDLETSYRVPLQRILGGEPGALTLRALVGYRAQNITISPLVPQTINTAGQAGNPVGQAGNPHWRANFSAEYANGPIRLNLLGRYIGPQVWDKTRVLGVNTDFQHISPAMYFDGQVSWEFRRNQEFYLNVQNILNKTPVYSPFTAGATPLPTDTSLYDQVGRMWTGGVRLRF